MSEPKDAVNDLVIELLELSNLESPFTTTLIRQHRRRLVESLLADQKIDQEMADSLIN